MSALTENQQMLADMAQKFARSLRDAGTDKLPDPAKLRGELNDMGWMAILIPEEQGGIGGSEVDLFLLAQAHGLGIPDTPFLSSAVLSASLLIDASNRTIAEALLPGIATGEIGIALAHLEHPHVVEPEDITTSATPVKGGYKLSGAKAMVPDGGGADGYLVSAIIAEGSDAGRIQIFHVPADSAGLDIRRLTLVDQRAAAALRFDGLFVADDQALFADDALAPLRRSLVRGQLALAGEALGACESAFDYAITHVKERRQFGKTLASFQVIRHRVADMYMMLEEVRAIGLAAAEACARDIDTAAELVRAAKVHVGNAGIWVVEQAVQVHGAMGITVEMGVGRCLQRIIVADALLGNSEHHLRRLADGYSRQTAEPAPPAYLKVAANAG